VVVTAATVVVTGVIVGVIEDIGASAPTAIAMVIVRIVDMAQLVRPRGTMAAAGLIHTTTHIRAFVAPLAGIMAPAASMALGSTVAGDTPTGDIAAATVAVCTGDGRSPCGAGTAGASRAAEDNSLIGRLLAEGLTRVVLVEWKSATPAMRFLRIDDYLAPEGRSWWNEAGARPKASN
jgi:hypothetical protein